MVVRPVAAGSKEWNSEKGQAAIAEEMQNHLKRGTFGMDQVQELDDIMKECRRSGEDVILGGVHPILGCKGAERGLEEERTGGV